MTSQFLKFTKNRRILILLALIVLSGITMMKYLSSSQLISGKISEMLVKKNKYLNFYYLIDGSIKAKNISLNVKDSDRTLHENILNSIIGNLVKFTPAGKLEPYLAESFSVSQDGKVWSYKLRDGLTCQDGTKITSETFALALKNQIFEYAKSTSPLDFEYLVGYQDFINNSNFNFEGIKTEGNTITFRFEKKPEDLNELLRMPYFGFWSNDTFKGLLKDQILDFISSGPYIVAEGSSSKKIILKKRKNWFSYNDKSPDYISFSYKDLEKVKEKKIKLDSIENDKNEYVIYELHSSIAHLLKPFPESLTYLSGSYDYVNFLVLRSAKDSFFKNEKNRIKFLNLIRKAQTISETFPDKFFYFSGKSIINEINTDYDFVKINNEPITIEIASYSPASSYALQLLEFLNNTFSSYDIKFKFSHPEGDPSALSKLINSNSNSVFDARIGMVMNGPSPLNYVVKMMFCSNLGVGFPDPSGRICKLVDKYKDIVGPLPIEYTKEFNQILYEDACVIPLVHSGHAFLLSKNINLNSLSPLSDNLLVDYLELE